MSSYLDKYLPGTSIQGFFDHFQLDPIIWTVPHKPDTPGTYPDPLQGEPGFLESKRVASDGWRIYAQPMPDPEYTTTRYRIVTPSGELTTVLQGNEHTVWVTEHLIKEKQDIEIIGKWTTSPACDVQAVNKTADQFGRRGMVRGHICCFDIFGQPGCWQDACCLVGTERLIMETYDDPAWVKELLEILLARKLHFTESLAGARYDLLELGGGDASTTVISPAIFNEFVAPYDAQIIEAAGNGSSGAQPITGWIDIGNTIFLNIVIITEWTEVHSPSNLHIIFEDFIEQSLSCTLIFCANDLYTLRGHLGMNNTPHSK